MRKNNSLPLRSALESFHGIRQHLKETNQLFNTLESKITEINKETKKKLKKPSQKASKIAQQHFDKFAYTSSQSGFDTTSAYRSQSSLKNTNTRFFASNITSPEYRQARTFAREDLSDYNQRTFSPKKSPSSASRFYHTEIKNLLDEKYNNLDKRHVYDPTQNQKEVINQIDVKVQANREERLKTNKDRIKVLEAEIKSREESRATIVPSEHDDASPRKSINADLELENFYQLKLDEIQAKISTNDAQISQLTQANEDLKMELTNLKKMMKIQLNRRESVQSSKRASHHDVQPEEEENENHLDIKRRIKLEKYNHQRQSTEGDIDLGHENDMNEDQQEAKGDFEEAQPQEAAQMNVLFELVNQYQINIEQIKRDNLFVQEKLHQEILNLKEELRAKQIEKSHAPENEERPSNQRSSVDYFEVMEKEDLAKYARGLQDTYAALEHQHLQAIEENKRLQEQLNEADNVDSEAEVYQHASEDSNVYHSHHTNHQEYEQSFNRKSLQKWEEYQYKLRNTPLNHHESPHKHLSPIKDSSEKDFSKFLIPTPNRKEITTSETYHRLEDELKPTPKSPQKINKKKSKKLGFGESFKGADGFVYQINRVKELVQSKIAENDAEISEDESPAYPPKRMCQTTDNFAQKSKKKISQKDR